MIAAGLLAKKAVARGLTTKPWVKTSLAPGSKVVTDYLTDAGLMPPLETLRFHVVGYGCTTCIGNSGPLPEAVSKQITRRQPGRRPRCCRATATSRAASTPRCGRTTSRRRRWSSPTPSPAGSTSTGRRSRSASDQDGKPVFLKDIWPTHDEVAGGRPQAPAARAVRAHLRQRVRGRRELEGAARADRRPVRVGRRVDVHRHPPYFERMTIGPPAVSDIAGRGVLAVLGDSITTDHISPAGNIKKDSPAGQVPDRTRRGAEGLQLSTAPGAGTTR